MQEAFLTLWERWDTIDRIKDPTGYLFRVALNGFRMRARTARRAARRLVAIDQSYDPFVEVNLREDVLTMLRSLSPRQRAALVLLDLYGYGSEEAAAIMRIRPSTVRALATQGPAVLRTAVGPHDRPKNEIKELFEMTTKQMEPDQDSWREQQRRQDRSSRKRKVGALFAVAAMVIAVAVGLSIRSETQPGPSIQDPLVVPLPVHHYLFGLGAVRRSRSRVRTGAPGTGPPRTALASRP